MLSHPISLMQLTLFGDRNQTRSFCFIDDLILGLVGYAESKLSTPMNLGNDEEITILELAGSKSKIINLPLPKDDPPQHRPDLTQARAQVGFRNRVKLREGLLRMLQSHSDFRF